MVREQFTLVVNVLDPGGMKWCVDRSEFERGQLERICSFKENLKKRSSCSEPLSTADSSVIQATTFGLTLTNIILTFFSELGPQVRYPHSTSNTYP